MRFLYQIRAALRIALVAILLGVGALVVLLLSPLPWRIGGIKLAAYPIRWMARAFFAIFAIAYRCDHPEIVRDHHGLLFCNHTSFLDVLLLLYQVPTRFLSTKGVRKLPLIGQLAVALDTVFVHRYDDKARAAARDEIASQLRQRHYPPLAIFPEGKIGPGHTVLPFRYGAIEIAKAEGVAILPCALIYEPLDVVTWYERHDSLIAMTWQLGMQRQLRATLIPLPVVQPQADDDVATLAAQMQETMQAAIDTALGKSGKLDRETR